jgi:hypothetical protein
MLGELSPVLPWGRIASVTGVAVASTVWVALQPFVLKLRAAEEQSRWASNVRDLIGVLAAACLVGALTLGGLPVPAAILVSGTVGVLLEVVRHGRRANQVRAYACALPIALAAALWPHVALTAANYVVAWLLHPVATLSRG